MTHPERTSANKPGAIINIGSYACFQSFPVILTDAATKGALAQLTRTLAVEDIGHGIRVNAVGSGDVVTNILNSVREDGPDFLAEHGKIAPIKRAAKLKRSPKSSPSSPQTRPASWSVPSSWPTAA